LLCRSIVEDGFTQPIIVQKETNIIVDGEHRWRACKHLGFDEIPVVYVNMSLAQARIATLRHNRARGSENADLAADVLRELAAMGALEWATDSLQLSAEDTKRMLEDIGGSEANAMDMTVPESMLGPDGNGPSELDRTKNIDLTADERRAKERILDQVKDGEDAAMKSKDMDIYKLVLFFSGDEAATVKAVIGSEGPAPAILRMCREEIAFG